MKVHYGLPVAATAAAFLGLGLIATDARAAELASGLKPGEAPPAFLVQDATDKRIGEPSVSPSISATAVALP